MESTWDFVQYIDKLNQPVSKKTEDIFECRKCHLMVDHGYRDYEKNKFLCSVCFKKHRFTH